MFPRDRSSSRRAPALLGSVGSACMLAALLTPLAGAQRPEQFTFSVDVERVVLDVTVTDAKGRPVDGLSLARFRVLEDGVEQQVLEVSQEDRPLTLGLVVDSSRSIGERRSEIIEGAMRLAALSHDDDDLFLVAFHDYPMLGLAQDGFTRNLAILRGALFRMKPEGMTALYDAVLTALDQLRNGKWEREAAVIFSDGGDTASVATLEQTLEGVRRSNALVYAIGLASVRNPYRSPKVLKKLARASGAEAYFPETDKELSTVCESIAQEMRSQYTLTYQPANPRQEGRYREIEVHVAGVGGRELRVRAREGYYEPGVEEKRR